MKYNKYKIQKLQISHDDGQTWQDVSPSITRYGDYIGTFDSQEDCISGTSTSSEYSWYNVEITDEMKNSLYTLIMDDGSYYIRKREDAWNSGDYREYIWREVGWGSYDYNYAELESPQVKWLPFWTSETDSEVREKVRVLVIGNQTTDYISDHSSTPFPKMVYVYMCDSVLVYQAPFDINVQKIRPSVNLNNIALNCPYLSSDLIFQKSLAVDNSLDVELLKNITIYGDLLRGSFYTNKTLLVYGSKGPDINSHGLAQLWIGRLSRMYVPDNVLLKYREQKNFGNYILPMSLYKIKLPTASGKGTAILYDGTAQVIPSDGTTKLTYSDLESMRNKIAYLTVSEGITELDTNCLRLADGAVTVSLPSTITTVKSILPYKIQNLIFNGTTVPTFVESWDNNMEVGNIYVPDSVIMDYARELIDKDPTTNRRNFWSVEILRGLSEYNYEHQDDKNYTPK